MIIENFRREIQEKCKRSRTGYRTVKEKMIRIQCDRCGSIHVRKLNHYNKMKIKFIEFDKDYCNTCWRPILNNRPDKIQKMKEALRKVWTSGKRKSHSELMIRQCKETGRMMGDNNPMKNLVTRQKVGKTRSARMTATERKKYSDGTRKAWEAGKFIGKKTTQCKWYDYIDQWDNNHKCQGTWHSKYHYLHDRQGS